VKFFFLFLQKNKSKTRFTKIKLFVCRWCPFSMLIDKINQSIC